MAWFPLYGWYKAVSAIHDYRKAKYQLQLAENGMNEMVAHAEKAPKTPSCDRGFWFIGSCAAIIGLVPNALLIFGNSSEKGGGTSRLGVPPPWRKFSSQLNISFSF